MVRLSKTELHNLGTQGETLNPELQTERPETEGKFLNRSGLALTQPDVALS